MPRVESLRLPNGAANGHVLTSDANGNATWQAGGGGGGAVTMDPWHIVGAAGEPSWQNGWVSASYPFRFRKDPMGRVWIFGGLQSGASNSTVFTLPLGYRPAFDIITHNLQANDAAGTWSSIISTTGNLVVVYSTGAAYLDLSFDTGQTTMPTGPAGPAGPVGGAANQVPAFYSVTAGYTKDRTLNPQATTLNEVAAVLGSLVDDLKAAGLMTSVPN